jgi:L,D-transpeptidase catalytic domain
LSGRFGRRLALVAALVAAATLVIVARDGPAPETPRASRALAAPDLPEPPAAAFRVGRPVPLPTARYESRWASVRRDVAARAGARAGTRVVARVTRRTPEGTSNLLPVLGRRKDASGRLWVRVRLPVLPNGTTGWVPRAALGGYGTVRTRLIVDRARLTATLQREGRSVFSARVGIGTPDAPTPAGTFLVRNVLTRYRSAFYGPIAFGTSARSATLTDWPGGGFVGIHGTDRPDLLPGRVSHGCVRMRNADIVRLSRLMPIGTPVTIR